MILSTALPSMGGGLPLLVAAGAVVGYLLALWPVHGANRWPALSLLAGWLMHLFSLVLDIGGWGHASPGARLGFAPVLSMTAWLVIAVHSVESRFVPLPTVRRWLAPLGAASVLLTLAFPGESRLFTSKVAPLHFVLGVASYGLFGAAVLHAALLDSAERRLRLRKASPSPGSASGMPLLQLERLTFRFVEAGFMVLTATLLFGMVSTTQWKWDHKTVFSLLAWGVFAALLIGRWSQGWRGRRATRWLYAGAVLLLLGYAGSRFVLEVMLGRSAT